MGLGISFGFWLVREIFYDIIFVYNKVLWVLVLNNYLRCILRNCTNSKYAQVPYPQQYSLISLLNVTLCNLGKIFSRRHTEIFFLFFPENRIWHFMQTVSKKTGFDISCKFSPYETICIKCQNPVSWGKNKKISPICRLLN